MMVVESGWEQEKKKAVRVYVCGVCVAWQAGSTFLGIPRKFPPAYSSTTSERRLARRRKEGRNFFPSSRKAYTAATLLSLLYCTASPSPLLFLPREEEKESSVVR